jgi:hypothetical protein
MLTTRSALGVGQQQAPSEREPTRAPNPDVRETKFAQHLRERTPRVQMQVVTQRRRVTLDAAEHNPQAIV